MCVDGCDFPDVILLDVDMGGATTEDGAAIPTQRLGYCVRHAAGLELWDPINRAIAVAPGTPGSHPFPNESHILYGRFAWARGV